MFTKEEEQMLLDALIAGMTELKILGKHEIAQQVAEIVEQGVGMVQDPQKWLENLLEVYELMYKEITTHE